MSFYTFHGYKCIANDMYQSIICRSKPRSFAIPANQSMLRACLSLIRFAQLRIVGFCLIAFLAPIDTLRVKPPIPIFARSMPFTYSLRSITNSLLSLDAGGFTLHRFVPYHNHAYMKPTNFYNP